MCSYYLTRAVCDEREAEHCAERDEVEPREEREHAPHVLDLALLALHVLDDAPYLEIESAREPTGVERAFAMASGVRTAERRAATRRARRHAHALVMTRLLDAEAAVAILVVLEH